MKLNIKKLPLLLSFISLIMLLLLLGISEQEEKQITDITHFKARTEDGYIQLSWQNPSEIHNAIIELTIQSREDTTAIHLDGNQTSYQYLDGLHGTRYSFGIKICDSAGNAGNEQQTQAMFLNWEQLPDLPLIQIETKNGVMPTASYVTAPEGCIGSTLADNDYVPSQLAMAKDGEIAAFCTTGIRLRGNTSAYAEKKPYKLKLDQPIDLLGREDPIYQDTEWLLLPVNKSFKTETGFKVSEICNQEWVPQYETVNLMINGDWMGCYNLVESIKKSPGRINISDTGFIIENDVYWWNEGDAYFHTNYHPDMTAYTFKFPDAVSAKTRDAIRAYIIDYEAALFEYTEDITNYIDLDSYVTWLLIHDIMGTLDCAGSNIYFQKYDFDPDDVHSSKLKMGPAWDFDSCFWDFGSYVSDKSQWTRIHEPSNLPFWRLFQDDFYREAFRDRWQSISPTISEEIETFLTEYITQNNNALQKSWDLDAARWGTEQIAVEDALQVVKDWFVFRTVWLDEAVSEF